MNTVKSLRSLLLSLTNDEMRILVKYLNYNNNGEEKGKSIQLIDLILDNKLFTYNDIQFKLYGKLNYSASSKLFSRLRINIFEILTFDLSLESNNFSKRNKVLLNLRKRLLQADIMQLKGIRERILPIYNSIIRKSRAFELYDIEIQALNSKQRLQSISSSLSVIRRTNDEILFAETCLQALKKSTDIFREISNKISHEAKHEKYLSQLEIDLEILSDYYDVTNSPTIGFYYYTLNAEYLQSSGNYFKAQNSLEKVEQLIKQSPSAFTANRYGNILLNISNNYIYIGNFKNAIEYANNSKLYLKNFPLAMRLVDEILFYCYYYSNDFKMCTIIVNQQSYDISDSKISDRFKFYGLYLMFSQKKFLECSVLLGELKDFESDTGGWNICKKILAICLNIEQELHDNVELQITNLDKYLKRLQRKNICNYRYLTILKIFKKLLKYNYDFAKVYVICKAEFNLLKDKNGELGWKIKSAEIMDFSNWFESKLTKLHYS